MILKNGMLSLNKVKKAIEEAEEKGAEYIDIEHGQLYFGKSDYFGFQRWSH